MPPIDGLHDICPKVSILCVRRSVRRPMRAAASAASVPAWPPPTTMTSKSSENRMGWRILRERWFHRHAGASFPPITVCMRTYLRQRLGDDAALSAAYSLDSVLIETMFIVGPLLVALFVAFASPRAAVWFAAASGFIGVFLFLRSAALRE